MVRYQLSKKYAGDDTFAAIVVKRVETVPSLKWLILQVAGFQAAEKAD